jgi:hypothetical protein
MGKEARLNKLQRELDEARLMVLRLVVSMSRVGRESNENAVSAARDKLVDWGLDLTADRMKCEALLGFKFW